MLLLPCQELMLHTRRDFPGDVRVYACAPEKLAAAICGPADDAEMLAEVCADRCTKKRPDPTALK